MKILFYTFLLAVITLACKNSKAEKQSDADTIAVRKNDTAKLSNFPGTSICIQLPNGFVWDEIAMGFYRDKDGSVIRYDEFKTMRHAANMPVEDRMGTISNQQPITVSGYKGEMKTYQLGSTGFKIELSFGEDTIKFIEATYFTRQEHTENEILAALKTLQVKKK